MLKVKDTGVGLTADALSRVFQLNSQLDGTLQRERGGLGISLTAIKPIVEIHGGMVTVHSDGPGQGCEFIVRLPLASAASTADASPTQQQPGNGSPNSTRGANSG
jgi:two-component system CheB/CheR fusion protein